MLRCLKNRVAALAFLALALPATAAFAAPAPAPVPILNAKSVWHIFEVLKPPVVQLDAGMTPITSKYEWVDKQTPSAPEGWTAVNFSDATWLRADATGGSHTPYMANLCLRARFEVTDPAQVKDLKLNVGYYGGAVVYLNGKEITRANVAKDARPGPDALADSYPKNVFILDNGQLVLDSWAYKGPKESITDRERKITDFPIPAADLKKGVNVLAIMTIRAPYDKVVYDYWKHQPRDQRELGEKAIPYDLNWDTCEMRDVTLTAAPAGIVPNASRPKQLQAWNSDLLTLDSPMDIGDACEPLHPVDIRGPQNGWSSGKVVLGLNKPIAGLKVTLSDFKQGPAVIPAADARVRYAVAMANDPTPTTPLDTLLEKPLDSFIAVRGGCDVPLWITVKVPANAKAGTYTASAQVEVAGEKALTVPITLQVADFAVPNTQDYKTWLELMQSPDTLAAEYNVPLWSDDNWRMIADSMRYIGEAGSRVLQIPLIAQTNSGNAQSMVRFIKKPDGSYDYDLSIMDKYLDTAVKNMGRPKFVAFIAWELYLATPAKEVTDRNPNSELSWQAARWDLRGKGPAVTALDPATGQISTINLPRFEDPAAKPIWKKLFDLIHQDMAKRGLEKTMLLGMASDIYPSKAELTVLQDVSGNLEWINHTHQGAAGTGGMLNGIAKVAYIAYVWPNVYPNDPDKGRDYGWKRPELWTEFRRFTGLNDWLLPAVQWFPEIEITGKQRGLGRVGADFWPVIKDKRGERRGWVWDKYPQSKWHSCNLMSHMLNPGPDGPVATARYEALREGMQECEARIAIESVLTNSALKEKLGADLATRSQALLDNRIWEELKSFSGLQLTGRIYTTYTEYGKIFYYNAGGAAGSYWFASSDWQAGKQNLYNMAGEVSRKVAP